MFRLTHPAARAASLATVLGTIAFASPLFAGSAVNAPLSFSQARKEPAAFDLD
jgi:hypothetical protein